MPDDARSQRLLIHARSAVETYDYKAVNCTLENSDRLRATILLDCGLLGHAGTPPREEGDGKLQSSSATFDVLPSANSFRRSLVAITIRPESVR